MKSIVALALGVVLTGACAGAQESTKNAKIERILALTNADAMIGRIFDQIKTMTASQMPSDATPEQRAKAQEMQNKVMDLIKARMSWERLRPQYAKLYDETFTESEIDGILAFYDSPAGRAMLEKMPVLMQKSMSLAQTQMADLLPEIERLTREAKQK